MDFAQKKSLVGISSTYLHVSAIQVHIRLCFWGHPVGVVLPGHYQGVEADGALGPTRVQVVQATLQLSGGGGSAEALGRPANKGCVEGFQNKRQKDAFMSFHRPQ